VLTLTEQEKAMLAGDHGSAVALAMRLITQLAKIKDAQKLIDIESVHVDGCLFYGQAGLDYAQKLVNLGAKVVVPTTVNVGKVDLLHPNLVRQVTAQEKFMAQGGRDLMAAYVQLGARQTWTCAPYQVDTRPEFGTDIVWAESNAIAFANSVLGARTDRYGDFMDIASAITGKSALVGLHLPENRIGHLVIDCRGLSSRVLALDITYPLLGYLAGTYAGTKNPIFLGIPEDVSEDNLKALGAAAASSGGVGLFHVVGRTPEAPTLDSVTPQGGVLPTHVVDAQLLASTRTELSTARPGTRLDAVSLGTPHASLAEISALLDAFTNGKPIAGHVSFYINTGRSVFAQATELGLVTKLEALGVKFVVDTCAYVTSIFRPGTQTAMTNSGKVAHYAPGNMNVEIVLGTLAECVASAQKGVLTWDEALFND
jgi:predicted aconitase